MEAWNLERRCSSSIGHWVIFGFQPFIFRGVGWAAKWYAAVFFSQIRWYVYVFHPRGVNFWGNFLRHTNDMPKFWLIHSRQGHWNSPSQNQTRFLLYLRFAGESKTISSFQVEVGWSWLLSYVRLYCQYWVVVSSTFFNVHNFSVGLKTHHL